MKISRLAKLSAQLTVIWHISHLTASSTAGSINLRSNKRRLRRSSSCFRSTLSRSPPGRPRSAECCIASSFFLETHANLVQYYVLLHFSIKINDNKSNIVPIKIYLFSKYLAILCNYVAYPKLNSLFSKCIEQREKMILFESKIIEGQLDIWTRLCPKTVSFVFPLFSLNYKIVFPKGLIYQFFQKYE